MHSNERACRKSGRLGLEQVYSERSDIFGYLFRIFVKPPITNIYQPEILEEWKPKLYKPTHIFFGR